MDDFKPSGQLDLARSLAREVREFVDTRVVPNEARLARESESSPLLTELRAEARRAGLWGVFYPPSHGGKIGSLEDYLLVAEQEGRSEFSQGIFGSHSALDAHMLLQYGTPELKTLYLEPLAQGQAVSAYAMTEPDKGGSFPALLAASAQLEGGHWTINGRKWFVCNSERANFFTVLARTGEVDTPLSRALSMLIVPADAPGFRFERPISMLGRFLGQGELSFTDVKVPEYHLLGHAGAGIALMGKRLSIGRLLRSMNWIGLAERCLDLMGERVHSERGTASRLTDKQLVRQHFVEVYQAISGARALIRIAARGVDAGRPNDVDINVAKMAASRAVCKAADSAVQLYGAEGLSELMPIEGIFRIARTSRILDGADEALVSAVGRRLIDDYQQHGAYYFE
jgi:acyl-CoA dehydrogenase